MGLRSRLFALTYNRLIASGEKAGLAEIRAKLLARACGDVLEVGAGTGLNLTHYAGEVNPVTVTEPDTSMLRRLERAGGRTASPPTILRAPAEDLPFEDDTFDMVVSTLVLCGVDDQPRAVREIRRVLRPRGRLLFLEHLRSDDTKLARTQDRLNWLNRFVVCCDCNRPTIDTITDTGFDITTLAHTSLPKAPPFARPTVVGIATPAASKKHPAPLAEDLGAVP